MLAKAMEMGLPTFTTVATVTHADMVGILSPLGAALPPAAGVENMSDLLWFLAGADWLIPRWGNGYISGFGDGFGNCWGNGGGKWDKGNGYGYGYGSGYGWSYDYRY